MSKNGPPWSHGEDEPYTEPADPWGDQAPAVSEPAWAAPAQSARQPVAYPPAPAASGAMWGPPAAPPRRSTPMLVLILTLVLLIVAGLVTAAWLLTSRDRTASPQATPSASAPAGPGPVPMGSEDARFYVKEGDCVVNEGTDAKPEMRTSPCTTGTYKVLKQIKGTTTGEKDAEAKCAKVRGYTKWYFYDSPFDELDFVLCLREHQAL